jgi:hypothetical protein
MKNIISFLDKILNAINTLKTKLLTMDNKINSDVKKVDSFFTKNRKIIVAIFYLYPKSNILSLKSFLFNEWLKVKKLADSVK